MKDNNIREEKLSAEALEKVSGGAGDGLDMISKVINNDFIGELWITVLNRGL